MFGKRITLFKLVGFEVHIDASWLILAGLIAWSLAAGLFPSMYKGLSSATYWWMGIAGALSLFVSIVFHELCHSLVARRFGLPMKGITLFIFGGVAEMDDEPENAKVEFLMAIAGPASSILLGFIFLIVNEMGTAAGWPVPVNGVLAYLMLINFLLAGFNLLPAFPLDGGRVLRSALWKWKDNLRWATRIASQIGSGFGVALMIVGGINVLFFGNIIGGIWWVLIGMFLRGASRASYRQIIIRKALEGEKVKSLMKKDVVTVPSGISVEDLVEEYVYKYHFKMFPVVDDGELSGCVTTRRLKEIPRAEWRNRTVGQITTQCSREIAVTPDMDVTKCLGVMNSTGNSRLIVVDKSRLTGVITLKDILGYLSTKADLDAYEE
ncbi:MAG: site-2 protease family protein [Candidatus Sulfobium sp.]|jgi:Zn-dependent protease/predicted transcriptional regulator